MATEYIVGLVGMGLVVLMSGLGSRTKLPFSWEHVVGGYGLLVFLYGQYLGLFWAPQERMMGEVGRILYVHVPAAWMALLAFLFSLIAAIGYLITSKRSWDFAVEALCEVGVVMTVLLIALGSIFARPTWGVWWDWDPRLTACAAMLLSYVGIILLRTAVTDWDRKATWSAAACIMAAINVPIVYYSVQWWRGLHQMGSTTETISAPMVYVLRLNAFAMLFICIWLVARRWRQAKAAYEAQAAPELPPGVTA